MLGSPAPEISFDLDYDDLGETRRVNVDPWTGQVRYGQLNDPDRTSRIRVDPWTGEVLAVEYSEPPVQTIIKQEKKQSARELRVPFHMAALIAFAGLTLGSAVGSILTLVTYAL